MGSVSGERQGESWNQCVGRDRVSHGISIWEGWGESWDQSDCWRVTAMCLHCLGGSTESLYQ